MRTHPFILGMSLVFLTPLTQASLGDVCELSQKEVSGANIAATISANEIQSYQSKLAKECELSSLYKKLNETLKSKNNISLTDITKYQALRFVERGWYDGLVYSQKPVEKGYQLNDAAYKLPLSEQKADIWDDWAMGVKQLEPTIESFKAGKKFDINSLKTIHRGLFPFYPMIDEHGQFAHEPNPGVLKPTASSEDAMYWWALDTADIDHSKRIVELENATYRKLGLLTPAPKGYADFVSDILNVRVAKDANNPGATVTALFSGHSVLNRQNTELILDMVDQLIKQARQGQHMIWKGQLMTPGELAYLVQQAYVRVHPFYEGNGRTSRFLQELILLSFNLPHGASGDLMNIDALTPSDEYYRKALAANFTLLNEMNQCADEYRNKDAHNIDAAKLSYNCRILADRSQEWDGLVKKNEIENLEAFEKSKTRLSQLNAQTEKGHMNELARRKAIADGKPLTTATTTTTSTDASVDECAGLTGAEKARCDRIQEIKKKLGVN